MTEEVKNEAPVADVDANQAVEAPSPEPSPAVEPPPTEQPKTETTEAPDASEQKPAEETVLGDKDADQEKPAEEKPVDEKAEKEKPAEEKPSEEKPVEEKVDEDALPTFEDFKLPEGIQIEKEGMDDFTKKLGEFQKTTKASQEEVQKFGQNLVDSYISEITKFQEKLHKHYEASWTKQREEWHDQFKKDPELGGNRLETTSKLVRDAIKHYAGSQDQANEFRELVNSTGIGNAPPIIRLVANMSQEISRLKAQYESEGGSKQLAAVKPPVAKKGMIEKMYGNTTT